MTKEERVEIVNKLIQFISERGRRYFYCESNRVTGLPHTAHMELKNGRVFFVDAYTSERMYAYEGYTFNGFSYGGTLLALVMDFSYFIRTGEHSDGRHGYGGLHGKLWGHDKKTRYDVIGYAKEIGYLRKERV